MESVKKIDSLLNKYFEGETDLREEAQLKKYFSSDLVDSKHKQYTPLFSYFSNNEKEQLSNAIKLPKAKYQRFKWMSIAASFALMASVYVGYSIKQENEIKDAFSQTQMALDFLSGNMNKGNQAFAQLDKFKQTTEIIYNQKNK
jgi:CO/xanthine dehydrogenase FAD-binding subunit